MDVKPEEIPEVTVQAVAETLRKSSSLKVSEDGQLFSFLGAFLFYVWMLRKCVLKEDFELFSANTNLELYVWIIRKCLLKENSEPLVANANVALNVLLN